MYAGHIVEQRDRAPFFQVRAVDGISLEIAHGATLALVGESGCGKTTAGKGVLRFIEPTEGAVRFNSENFIALKGQDLRRRRADIQFIFTAQILKDALDSIGNEKWPKEDESISAKTN